VCLFASNKERQREQFEPFFFSYWTPVRAVEGKGASKVQRLHWGQIVSLRYDGSRRNGVVIRERGFLEQGFQLFFAFRSAEEDDSGERWLRGGRSCWRESMR
jgi:hypothetical protein